MPVVLLERLPLPSLKTYTSISVLLLACALYYAHQIVTHPHQEKQQDIAIGALNPNDSQTVNITANVTNKNDTKNDTVEAEQRYLDRLVDALIEEAWCTWTLINMAYCCLILLGRVIQHIVFGELRVSEQQHLKDKFWNFVFYKFIFIFGVMNVQNMVEVSVWCAWFSVLGFLHLLAQLCKDRFEYLSFSPTTPRLTHAKVLSLLFAIQVVLFWLVVLCGYIGFYAGINTFAFMTAECILLMIKSLYVITRYGIHLWDVNHDGVWENRAIYVYYTELVFELGALSVDFAHHLHMLVWGNIFLSMASLVICMQLRYLFHEFQRRIRRHKNYLRVVSSMEARFPMALPEELEENNDDCAICWDKLETARKLPCGHLFHNACLRSWLEQDTSCPTCRMSLAEPEEQVDAQVVPTVGENIPEAPPPRPVNQTTNHFFHFDGSRYVSWFPSFSVEVTHTQILGNGPGGRAASQSETSQLDNMVRQVQGIFPNMPLEVIVGDLGITRSVELTIENIIEGRLVAPPNYTARLPASTDPDEENLQLTPSNGAMEGSEECLPGSSASSTSGSEGESPATSASINFISDDNIPHLNTWSDSDESLDDFSAGAGSRFSKSSSEREQILDSRKLSLLENARRKFLAKEETKSSVESMEPSSRSTVEAANEDNQDTELRRRRELAYKAAQRRLDQH